MSLSWATIEDAIATWVAGSSGLEVVWEEQNSPRPDPPYIALTGVARISGQDWATWADAAVPAPGAEIEQTARGVRSLELTVTCFGGDAEGASMPAAVLDSVILKASLESYHAALDAAGWSPARFEPVQKISGLLGAGELEPRAQFVCSGFANAEVTETGTYIQIAKVTNTLTGVETILDSEA